MNGIVNFLIGYAEYICPEKLSADVFNSLIDNKIQFFGVSSDGENVRFFIARHKLKKAEKYLEGCKRINEKGLLVYLVRRKNRIGLVFGAVFCVVCVCISMRFVWDIEVQDKENEEKIIALLKEAGLEPGSYIPEIDEDIVEIRALLATDEFSYISITFEGTVAYVESEKRVTGTIPDDSTAPSNIIASDDGKIVRLEVHSGDSVCFVGQTVEKGQLLISGFDETKNSGTKVVRAKGNVLAMVEKSFSVSYPRNVKQKVYTGRQYTQKEYSVCGVKMTTGANEEYENCDTAVNKRKITVFSSVTLPVYVTETTYREYVYEDVVLSDDEMHRRAKMLYLERLNELSCDCEVLSREVKTEKTEDEVIISCTLDVICSIAKEEKITVNAP